MADKTSQQRSAGRLGGLATARKHPRECLSERASKGGTATKTLYGAGFYRHIRLLKDVAK